MKRKFSELTPSERIQFQGLVDFMKETWNEDFQVKLNIIKKFRLDPKDPVVYDFLTDIYIPAQPQITPISTTSEQAIEPAEQQKQSFTVSELSLSTTTTTQRPIEKTKRREMTYANSEDLIIVQNRLLHAISHLTLNERRLILFLSPIIRKQLSTNPDNKSFVVRVEDFMSEYGLNGGTYYSELEKTAISIQHKFIEFWNYDENGKIKSTVRLSWVTKGEYFKDRGCIELQFHDEVIEMLTVFDKNTGNFWTQYQKEWIINLGAYGIIMLELVLSSFELNLPENKGKTKGYYTVEHLREKFNCIDNYARFSDFKLYVIEKSIKEIHKNTPIRISYEVHKIGRFVNGVAFSYIDTSIKNVKDKTKNNDKPQEKNPFANFKMSQKQLSLFASKIKKASGQDVEEIIAELSNVHLQSKHINFLKVLDYVPSDWYSDDEIGSHPTAEQIARAKADEKAQAKAEKEQKQRQLKQDFEKLVNNAELFVKSNLKRVRKTGIQQMYFKENNYVGIVKTWEHDLLNENTRKHFTMIDEILAM